MLEQRKEAEHNFNKLSLIIKANAARPKEGRTLFVACQDAIKEVPSALI